MKILILVALIAITAASAFARPGETITQWKKRFENSEQTPVDELGVFVKLTADKSGINVSALSQKNAVIYEHYTKFVSSIKESNHNPVAEITAILKSLSDGKEWTTVVEQTAFYSSGKWTFGTWTAEYEPTKRKLHVFTPQWLTCKLRNTLDWPHETGAERKPVAPPKLGL